MDTRLHLHALARYINDCRNMHCYNVTFLKCPSEGYAQVVATRDISAGEEVYADYGRWYWAGAGYRPKRLIKVV